MLVCAHRGDAFGVGLAVGGFEHERGVGVAGRLERGLVALLVAVAEELDRAGRVGEVVLSLDQPEGPCPAREDVDAAVLHPLEHPLDRDGAADRLELVVGEPDDAELAVVLEALGDHRAVARLEDVQRHVLARQRDESSGKSGKSRSIVWLIDVIMAVTLDAAVSAPRRLA